MKRFLLVAILGFAGAAFADPVEVIDVNARKSGENWRFDVTLLHPDTGWNHYADAWEVRDADGNRLGLRELAHPHVNEQPFTRSQSGIVIPQGVTTVYVRGRDNVDGWSDEEFIFDLP